MSGSFVSLKSVSYVLPNGDELFDKVSFDLNQGQKAALIGDNGVGKSTLMKIIIGELAPYSGEIIGQARIAYVPQNVNDFAGSIGEVLQVADKINALQRIERGIGNENDFELVGNDWDLPQRCLDSLKKWKIGYGLEDDFELLSGGEKEKILLIKALLSSAEIILMDEPTNNLDAAARQDFYDWFEKTTRGILVVSHDRDLLSKIQTIWEMLPHGVRCYGGNYEFYKQCREQERQQGEEKLSALQREVSKLKEDKIKIQEQQDKKSKYGREQVGKSRFTKMAGGMMKDWAEKSGAKKANKVDEKLDKKQKEAYDAGLALKTEVIKIPLPEKPFIKDKLLEIKNLDFGFGSEPLLKNINLLMPGGQRLELKGANGAGKTTLIKLILGRLKPCKGEVRLNGRAVYLNQDLSLLDKEKNILENVLLLNPEISTNEAYAILANFKFRNIAALKLVKNLSGGELLKASLAAILGTRKQPELLILDEPTNNLDIRSAEILEEALRQYQGALIIVSHDKKFLENIGTDRQLVL